MGLLSQIFGGPDQTQALGLLGMSMMQGNAPQGFGLAMQHMAGAKERAMKHSLLDMQMQEALAKIEADKKRQEFLQSIPSPQMAASQSALAGGGGPTVENAGRIQAPSPYQNLLHQGVQAGAIGLGDYLKTFAAPESPINKLDPKDFTPQSLARFAQTRNYSDLERLDKLHFADTGGGVQGLNPFTGAPVGAAARKTGNPFNDLLLSGPDGRMQQNAPLIDAKRSIAKAGASSISVNTEKNLLGEVAAGAGKAITTGGDNARSALGTLDTVGRLMDALDSGKVIAGPAATFQQYGLQVGERLGLNGKSAKETLLNTRQAVQSLAQLELDAAQMMKGQGQITEAERSIIRRAASGDIDSMTVQELRLLGGVLDRSARSKIRAHNSRVAPLKANPNAAILAPMLEVEEPPERTVAPAATGAPAWRWDGRQLIPAGQ